MRISDWSSDVCSSDLWHPGRRSRRAGARARRLRTERLMFEYILRLLILLPLVGGMAWGSLWLWKRVQMGVPLVGGATKTRAIEMVDVLPLGPGSKLAVVEFAGQRVLIAVSRNGITRIADDSQGDFHVD